MYFRPKKGERSNFVLHQFRHNCFLHFRIKKKADIERQIDREKQEMGWAKMFGPNESYKN